MLKKILSLSLFTCILLTPSLVLGEDFKTDSPKVTNTIMDIVKSGKYKDDFDLNPHGLSIWEFTNSSNGNGEFSFEEGAKGIKITFIDTTNKETLYSDKIINVGKSDSKENCQGMERVTFVIDMIKSHTYTLTLENLDNQIVSGTFSGSVKGNL